MIQSDNRMNVSKFRPSDMLREQRRKNKVYEQLGRQNIVFNNSRKAIIQNIMCSESPPDFPLKCRLPSLFGALRLELWDTRTWWVCYFGDCIQSFGWGMGGSTQLCLRGGTPGYLRNSCYSESRLVYLLFFSQRTKVHRSPHFRISWLTRCISRWSLRTAQGSGMYLKRHYFVAWLPGTL